MSDRKTCTKCGEVKAVAEFYSFSGSPCKECQKKQSIAWRKENPEKRAATEAAHRKKNHKKIAARHAAYARANAGKISEYSKAYKKRNPQIAAKSSAAVCQEMRPAYVAHCIRLSVLCLTPELLSLKRQQLETHRLTKEINQALKAQGASA